MSKRPTLGSFLCVKSNPRPRSREIRSIPRVSPPSLGSGITLIDALQVQILTYYTVIQCLLTCDLLVLIILSHQNRMLFQDSMIFHAIPMFPRPSLIIRQRRYQRKYHTEEISNFDISSV